MNLKHSVIKEQHCTSHYQDSTKRSIHALISCHYAITFQLDDRYFVVPWSYFVKENLFPQMLGSDSPEPLLLVYTRCDSRVRLRPNIGPLIHQHGHLKETFALIQ